MGPGRVGRILDILKRGPDAPSAPDRPGSHLQAGADDPPDTTGRDEEGATENRPEEDENPGVSCPVGANSFVPGTLVLMADGGYRAIEGIDAGERVWAFDPATGEEGPRAVTGLITGGGAKTLVDITVTDDTGETGTVTATDEHPFWAVERAEWVAAVDLEPGEWLRTSAGTWTQASAVKTRAVPDQQVHNLTVEDLHTYYVAVGETGVLVHNQDDCIPGPPRVIDDHGLRHSFDRHANEWFGGNPARSTHGDQWREVIEMGMRSKKVVEWQSGSTPTYGHLVRADGKYFFVQFSRESGSLVTAFRPSGRQLSVILEKLGKQ